LAVFYHIFLRLRNALASPELLELPEPEDPDELEPPVEVVGELVLGGLEDEEDELEVGGELVGGVLVGGDGCGGGGGGGGGATRNPESVTFV